MSRLNPAERSSLSLTKSSGNHRQKRGPGRLSERCWRAVKPKTVSTSCS
jgi:hypothetical protein